MYQLRVNYAGTVILTVRPIFFVVLLKCYKITMPHCIFYLEFRIIFYEILIRATSEMFSIEDGIFNFLYFTWNTAFEKAYTSFKTLLQWIKNLKAIVHLGFMIRTKSSNSPVRTFGFFLLSCNETLSYRVSLEESWLMVINNDWKSINSSKGAMIMIHYFPGFVEFVCLSVTYHIYLFVHASSKFQRQLYNCL